MIHPVVCCRVRPLSTAEKGVITCSSSMTSVEVDSMGSFEMDHVFGPETSQEQLFSRIVPPLLTDLMRGINCTLFTYGQTGSGKTFTMQGASSDPQDACRGIIPRVVDSIFNWDKGPHAAQHSNNVVSTRDFHFSMLEIYQEKLNDLLAAPILSSTSSSKEGPIALRIRELGDGTIFVQGLSEIAIKTADEFHTLLAQGLRRRVTGGHNMNQESSRSHLCCIIFVRQQTSSGVRTNSKIHLIDLAGSELVRKTAADGTRLQEAKHINKSLSALGNVINALTTKANGAVAALASGIAIAAANASTNANNSKSGSTAKGAASYSSQSSAQTGVTTDKTSSVHIPYRDSKLTRVLQDSLGGNSRIVLVLAVSASAQHSAETVATLRFGERARKLTTKPRVNTELDERDYKAALASAQKKIVSLTDTISELQAQLKSLLSTASSSKKETADKLPASNPLTSSPVLCAMCSSEVDLTISGNHKSVESQDRAVNENERLPPIHPAPAQGSSGTSKPIKPKPSGSKAAKASVKAVQPEREQVSERTPVSAAANLTIAVPTSVPSALPGTIQFDQSCGDNDGSYVNFEDDRSRCAVCSLDEVETEQLRRDTGEVLGSMFLCDGNCGQRFHVRCVGLIGDAGQFVLPDGEWLCSVCTLESSDRYNEDMAQIIDNDESSVSGSRPSSANRDGKTSATGPSPSPQLVSAQSSRVIENDSPLTLALSTLDDTGPMLNKNDPKYLASLQADYHLMRRERNRVLAQWQHEKKISRLVALKREEADLARDKELVELSDEVTKLKDELNLQDLAIKRLQQENRDLLQLAGGNRKDPSNLNQTDDGKKSSSQSKPISLSSSLPKSLSSFTSLRDMLLPDESNEREVSPIRRGTSASQLPIKDEESTVLISDSVKPTSTMSVTSRPLVSRSLESVGVSHTSFDPLRAAVGLTSTLPSDNILTSSSTKYPSESGGTSIPKPWKKKASGKVIDESRASQISSTLLSGALQPVTVNKFSGSGHTTTDHVSTRVTESPAGIKKQQPSSSNIVATNDAHVMNSDRQSVSGALGTGVSVHKAGLVVSSSIASGSSTTLPDSNDSSNTTSSSNELLAPIQSRLQGLLQAVQAEAGSFAEIRMKHREREDERLLLRTSQQRNRRNGVDNNSNNSGYTVVVGRDGLHSGSHLYDDTI